MKKTISAAAADSPSQGFLQVHVVNIENNFPNRNATISISYKGEPDSTLEETTTNSSGQTDQITLPAPLLEYSLQPSEQQPYSEYHFKISAPGY